MSTYTQILYQIVFGPHKHQPILLQEHLPDLYKFITGLLKKKNCHLYQIGGMEDHLHIVTHVHPTVEIASLIKDIKLASGVFIKQQNIFPHFQGWQEGYGAFTYSYRDKSTLIRYVQNQQEHHKVKTFREELIELLEENGITFDERYLF